MTERSHKKGVGVMPGTDGSQYIFLHGDSRGDVPVAEGFFAMDLELLRARGVPITPDVLEALKRRSLRREAEFIADARSRGVSLAFRKLLGAKRAKEVKSLAKQLVITKTELADLHFSCSTVGLTHSVAHHQFLPEARRLSDGEVDALSDPDADAAHVERARRKVDQVFEERENRSVHMFANEDAWHCIFLTYRDVAGDPHTGEHHWSCGSHVHFTNHLLCNLDRKRVLGALSARRHSLPCVHIRYDDEDRSKPNRQKQFLIARNGRVIKAR